MKYVIWAAIFVTYVLVFVGIFKLMAGLTKGIEVEMDVEREVYGETIVRKQMVEFNEIPAVKWIFGMSGLFIATGGGYMAANYLGKAWDGEESHRSSKTGRLIWTGTFIVLFFAFSFTFRIHTIDDIFGLTGWLFMAATCVTAYIVSTVLCKQFEKKDNTAAPAAGGNEVI